jgi:hypothetical protein
MKTNELRIGNFIYAKEIETIKAIGIENYIWFDKERNLSVELCEPIPLTEEWLEKNGFERKGLNGYLTIFTPCGKGLVFKDNYFIFAGVTIETPIKYIHQLQNLYFALTGEELTISNAN